MSGVVYDQFALIDSSAVIALLDTSDQFHEDARRFFMQASDFNWFTVITTAHELFTRVRYDKGLQNALTHYAFLRNERFRVLTFDAQDERKAQSLLRKYNDQTFSFHDALCAVVMLREGIYRVFTFDADFWTLGFQVFPGRTG